MRLLPTLIVVLPLLGLGCIRTPRAEPSESSHAEQKAQFGKIHVKYLFAASDLENRPKAFTVYRSDAPGGPFRRINGTDIPANREFAPGDLQVLMTDYALPMNQAYYYYLEAIDNSGKRRKITGVTRALVVLPVSQAEGRGKR